MRAHRGFSLLEVLVVLVLIALMATMSGMALRGDAEREAGWREQLLAARRRAASTGVVLNGFADSVGAFSVHPGGMAVTDSGARISFAMGAHAR